MIAIKRREHRRQDQQSTTISSRILPIVFVVLHVLVSIKSIPRSVMLLLQKRSGVFLSRRLVRLMTYVKGMDYKGAVEEMTLL